MRDASFPAHACCATRARDCAIVRPSHAQPARLPPQDKCMGNPGNRLSNSEETCLSNCAKRYLDVTRMAVEKLSNR